MTFKEIFPNERLRQARHLKGWTQSELAAALDTDFETVSRWERGVTLPSAFYREKLCQIFGNTAEELGLLPSANESTLLPPFPLVFLAAAYADAEHKFASLLKTHLQVNGITAWGSRTLKKQGEEDKRKALQKAISAAQVILLLVSPETRSSRWVHSVLEIAALYQRPICAIWLDGEDWEQCIPKALNECHVKIDARQKRDATLLDEIVTKLEQFWLITNTSLETSNAEGTGAEQAETPAMALSSQEPRKLARDVFLRLNPPYRKRLLASSIALFLLWILTIGLLTQFLPEQVPVLHIVQPTIVTTLREDGPGSLYQAITDAKPGSTITFDKRLRGTITLANDDLNIAGSLTILGPGADMLAITGANHFHRIHVFKGATVSISGLAFKDSVDATVGFIYNEGTLTLLKSTISGNRAIADAYGTNGGGIFNSGALNLINSSVTDNSSDAGGGIFNQGTLVLTASTVSGNNAHTGGGIYSAGQLMLTNSTISDNTAVDQTDGYGGGIDIADGQTRLNFCTIYGNTAQYGGGIYVQPDYHHTSHPRMLIGNSIVAGNVAEFASGISGNFTSLDYNLIQSFFEVVSSNPRSRSVADEVESSSLAATIDPRLVNNGGPTLTHALLPDSPAIDQIPIAVCHADGVYTDQRGVKRPQGPACDIGSYEYVPSQ